MRWFRRRERHNSRGPSQCWGRCFAHGVVDFGSCDWDQIAQLFAGPDPDDWAAIRPEQVELSVSSRTRWALACPGVLEGVYLAASRGIDYIPARLAWLATCPALSSEAIARVAYVRGMLAQTPVEHLARACGEVRAVRLLQAAGSGRRPAARLVNEAMGVRQRTAAMVLSVSDLLAEVAVAQPA
jgi:hypothetical protein